MCSFGSGCYRKNPKHFEEVDHPADHPLLSTELEQPPLKCARARDLIGPYDAGAAPPAAVEAVESSSVAEATVTPPMDAETQTAMDRVRAPAAAMLTDDAVLDDASLMGFDMDAAIASHQDHGANAASASAATLAGGGGPSTGSAAGRVYTHCERGHWQALLQQAFRTAVGDDVFALFELCQELNPKSPTRAMRAAGIQMLAPFKLLSSELPSANALSDRGVHDPAEFLPLFRISADGTAQPPRTVGYWRDDPQQEDALVVVQKPLESKTGPGVSFSVLSDNVVGAVHALLSTMAKGATLRADEARRLLPRLAAVATAAGLGLEGDKCKAAATRKRKVVGPTSNKMGIVVPYDKRTEVGYRSLDPSGESLRKLLYRQVSAKPEARAAPQSELDELVNWANIANDECDFGASLQLGSDLFNHSPQVRLRAPWHSMAPSQCTIACPPVPASLFTLTRASLKPPTTNPTPPTPDPSPTAVGRPHRSGTPNRVYPSRA